MKDPEYRIVTLCPMGMSPKFKEYLNQTLKADSSQRNRDAIALKFTSHFNESKLPYAGLVLGWVDHNQPKDLLNKWLMSLVNLNSPGTFDPIQGDWVNVEFRNGTVALGGFYPLFLLPGSQASAEASRLSVALNTSVRKDLLDWAHRTFLHGVLQTDPLGVICAVLAEQGDVADAVIRDVVSLLQDYNFDEPSP